MEVPLRTRRGDHVGRAHAHLVEQRHHLVHQRDVDVALGVSRILAASATRIEAALKSPARNHARIEVIEEIGHRRGRTRHDLLDVGKLARRVGRIDALRRVAQVKVHALLETRHLFDHRQAAILCGPRIDRAFKDDDSTPAQVLADGARCGKQRPIVRPVMAVHRRGHADDDDLGLLQGRGVGGEFGIRRPEFLAIHLACEVDAAAQFVDFLGADVEADGARGLRIAKHQRQPDIAKPNDRDPAGGRVRQRRRQIPDEPQMILVKRLVPTIRCLKCYDGH